MAQARLQPQQVFYCAAAAAGCGAPGQEKWIALSHESISVALHKVSLQPFCCLTSPKQTRQQGLQSASHHSHHFPLSLSRPNSLSLCSHSSSFSVKPYNFTLRVYVFVCVSLERAVKCSLQKVHKSPFAVSTQLCGVILTHTDTYTHNYIHTLRASHM